MEGRLIQNLMICCITSVQLKMFVKCWVLCCKIYNLLVVVFTDFSKLPTYFMVISFVAAVSRCSFLKSVVWSDVEYTYSIVRYCNGYVGVD